LPEKRPKVAQFWSIFRPNPKKHAFNRVCPKSGQKWHSFGRFFDQIRKNMLLTGFARKAAKSGTVLVDFSTKSEKTCF
jgi:hypothetical protein